MSSVRSHPQLREQRPNCVSSFRTQSKLREKRPLTEKEQLEQKMAAAVEREDYEQAAEMRDAIRELGKSNANH